MVPRTAVQAIPLSAGLEAIKSTFRALGYSRLPVFRDQLDEIAGILFRKDLEPYLEQSRADSFELENVLRPPKFIPASAPLGVALKQMQASRAQLAIVVDEHGGMEGIITVEDLLEEIVGEINDEYDEEVRSQITKESNGSYELSGMLTVRDANRQLNLRLPEDSGYTTLAGFLLAKSGRLLLEGEIVRYEGMEFKIESVDKRRIGRVRYFPPQQASTITGAALSFVTPSMIEPLEVAALFL
jgi:CBS domain containing-hemolysin-like protein